MLGLYAAYSRQIVGYACAGIHIYMHTCMEALIYTLYIYIHTYTFMCIHSSMSCYIHTDRLMPD